MQTDDLFNRFLEIIDALEKEKVDYVLIGGFAMVLYGMPRATQDIDIFIKNQKENIDRLQKALFAVFNTKNIFEITYSEFQNYPVIRYGADEGYYVDILTSIGTTFSFDDLIIDELTVEDHKIKIASVETLYKLKEKTLRAIDKSDLLFLKQLLKGKK
ncbi:MAG: nucleotidyl transferase AbiEii/AbiGii toxin family protein [Ignavibacteriaceae bacterium]|nr:nucleotidyl transferase AbiEii/AbiGii toxin family protein [Ignavibacteriaceae bacterium]